MKNYREILGVHLLVGKGDHIDFLSELPTKYLATYLKEENPNSEPVKTSIIELRHRAQEFGLDAFDEEPCREFLRYVQK